MELPAGASTRFSEPLLPVRLSAWHTVPLAFPPCQRPLPCVYEEATPLCDPLGAADSVNAHSTGVEELDALIGHFTLAVVATGEPPTEAASASEQAAAMAAVNTARALMETP